MAITIKKRPGDGQTEGWVKAIASQTSVAAAWMEQALKDAKAAGHTVIQDTVLIKSQKEPNDTRLKFRIPSKASGLIQASGHVGYTVVITPPAWRDHSKQRTVIRFDRETKRYYVDEYWERCSPALVSSVVKDGYRPARSIYCTTFNFQVALAACHYYCAKPCQQHMAALENGGWYNLRPFLQTDAQLIPASSLRRKSQKEQ